MIIMRVELILLFSLSISIMWSKD